MGAFQCLMVLCKFTLGEGACPTDFKTQTGEDSEFNRPFVSAGLESPAKSPGQDPRHAWIDSHFESYAWRFFWDYDGALNEWTYVAAQRFIRSTRDAVCCPDSSAACNRRWG
jgi:hypothetical protein